MTNNGAELERDPVELIAVTFIEQCRAGMSPEIEAYAAQYPELADKIRDLFPTIAALEVHKQSNGRTIADAATSRKLKLTELGDFKIIREIGRGGMGIVYEAEQESLGRRVALKVLPKLALLDPSRLQRFQREARMEARLHHTNLVSLHGIGEQNGYHFLVMELIDGASLDKLIPLLRLLRKDNRKAGTNSKITEQASSEEQALQIARQLNPANKRAYFRIVAKIGRDAAGGLQHSFESGILHRDIKPGNLILDQSLRIWISDFGMARPLNDQSSTENLSGTLCYMPPEGFEGRLDERSDIFSLGLTVYELLTLQMPFQDCSPDELTRRVLAGSFQPQRPRESDPHIPRNLEAVILKAVAVQPDRRYATASEFADDLQRFLDNQPVNARRASYFEHMWRWCQRNRAITGLALLSVSMLMLVASVMTTSYFQVLRFNREVTASLKRETNLRGRAVMTLQVATLALDAIYEEFVPSDMTYVPGTEAIQSESSGLARRGAPPLSAETAVVLEHLLTFYDRLVERSNGSLTPQRASAKSLSRIADIYRQLGQSELAIHRYEEALQMLGALRETEPELADLCIEEARIDNEMGRVFFASRNYVDARNAYAKAIDAVDELEDTCAIYQRARAYYYLGRNREISASTVAMEQLLGRENRPTDAGMDSTNATSEEPQRVRYLQDSIASLNRLSADKRDQPAFQFLMACCYRELAPRTGATWNEAFIADNEKAVELLNDLTERFLDNQYYRFELVETLRSDIYGPPQRLEGQSASRKCLGDAMIHADLLVEKHPRVPHYAMSRMHVLHRLGHVLTDLARNDSGKQRKALLNEATQVLVQAHVQMNQITKRWPNDSLYQLWSVVVSGSLAQVLVDVDRKEEARVILESAIDSLDRLAENERFDVQLQSNLSDIRRALANIARYAGADDLVEILEDNR